MTVHSFRFHNHRLSALNESVNRRIEDPDCRIIIVSQPLCFTIVRSNNNLLQYLGSINVTKSIEKYPTIPRSLQAFDTASAAVQSTGGSTEVWGTEYPQHLNGDVA